MTKKTKMLIVIGIMIISLVALGVKAFAETYTSTIDMLAGNTTLQGSTRKYSQRNHQISIHVTNLPATTNMYMALVKDGVFSDTTVSSKEGVRFETANKTYSYYMGNYDTGKYYYYFSTFGQGRCGAFYADPVYMMSYD